VKRSGNTPKVRRRKAVTRISQAALISNLPAGPFQPGAIVLVTLNNPREKFWGAVLALTPAGLSFQGLELSLFEDATNMVVAGDPFSAATLFFPMHRVERVELDLPEGNIPSLSQRFTSRTGLKPTEALARAAAASGGAEL
jgi:hypothetical protein